MKRGREVTRDIHKTEQCDEWLSTRNKHKIKPPSPKPRRRKSGVYKGFPRQPSSNLWHLTQSAPPHPLLLKATKQSTIQGFFKHAPSPASPSTVNAKSPEYEEGDNSSFEEEDYGSEDLEFVPQDVSTQKLDHDRNRVIEKSCNSREETLDDSCVIFEPCVNSEVERPSTVVDQCETESFDLDRDKLQSNQECGKLISADKYELFDPFSNDSENDDNLSLKRIRRTSRFNNCKLDHTELERSFSFTDVDKRTFKRSEDNLTFSSDVLDTQSEYTVNNSIMFTQTETNKSLRENTDNILDDDTTDSFEEILKKVRQRRRKIDDSRPKGDVKVTNDNETFNKRVGAVDQSVRKALSKEQENNTELRKTGPFTLNTNLDDSENFEPCAKRSRRDLLQNRFHLDYTDTQTDIYLQTEEQSSSQLSVSDTVSPRHLSPSVNSPTGKPHTQALETRRPYWITRSPVNEKVSEDKSAMMAKSENDTDFIKRRGRRSDLNFIDDSVVGKTEMTTEILSDKNVYVRDRYGSKKYEELDFLSETDDIKYARKGNRNYDGNPYNHTDSTELDFLHWDVRPVMLTNKDKFSQVCVENSLQFTPTQQSQGKIKRGKRYEIEADISFSFE